MALPLLKSLDLLQVQWKSILDPIVASPIVKGLSINSITLVIGDQNVIPTTLSRMQQGWFITDISYPSGSMPPTTAPIIYRSAPFNGSNLTLTSDSVCIISLWVY